MTQFESSFQKNVDNVEIAYVLCQPKTKACGCVLLVHGLGGQKNSETHLALSEVLAKSNIATLRFDFPGHGDSSGTTTDLTIESGARIVKGMFAELQKCFPDAPIGLVGASFGATAVLSSSILNKAAAIVFRSPVSDYAAVREHQLGPEKMAEWHREGVIGGLISQGRLTSWKFYEEAQKLDLFAKVMIETTPLLLVQGTKDLTVPMEDTSHLCQAWGGHAELVKVDGGDHSLEQPQHTEMFISLCHDWFLRYFQ